MPSGIVIWKVWDKQQLLAVSADRFVNVPLQILIWKSLHYIKKNLITNKTRAQSHITDTRIIIIIIIIFSSFITRSSLLPFAHSTPTGGERLRAEGREEGREGEREGEGGGGVRQYHSSNIFHPLRPSSEPLLVGIVWILSRTWHSAKEQRGRRIIGEPSFVLLVLYTEEPLLSHPVISIFSRRMDE